MAAAVAIEEAVLKAEFPSKLRPLFEAIRYKILEGGRGGAKSWSAARALLTLGVLNPLRILCAREVMKTIKESVHQLLKDQVEALGYESVYTDITENSIKGINGTTFTFTGLRSVTAANLKSFEGIDIVWVEEGQAVSQRSWNILIPTIRKENSEIWVTFNPELDSDDTWVRFVENPHPDSVVIHINHNDNPWFTKILEQERVHAKRTMDTETYDNIWEGTPRTVLEGAIYAHEVRAMVKSGRYAKHPYDPRLPVHTAWDLGWNDQNTIICFQILRGEITIIDYLEASFLTPAMWVKVLDKLPYVWGTDYLPWDGNTTSKQTGKSYKQQLKKLGRKKVLHQNQHDGNEEKRIKAARTLYPRMYMDNTHFYDFEVGEMVVVRGVGRLMECTKRYRRNVPTTTEEPSTPRHDQYCHGCDALGMLAQIADKVRNDADTPELILEKFEPSVKGVM